MSDFAKSIPSETEEGSPGPFDKNIPSVLLEIFHLIAAIGDLKRTLING